MRGPNPVRYEEALSEKMNFLAHESFQNFGSVPVLCLSKANIAFLLTVSLAPITAEAGWRCF